MMAIFRVFISSTFKDFESEREILQTVVFPKLEKSCRERGAEFLGVDLRWGISPERSSISKTIQTCFDEIHRCQQLSPKPNFVVLLGERYGYVPIPETVPDSLYRLINDYFENENEHEAKRLWQSWYRQDKNDLEREWLIKPREECDGYHDLTLKQSLQDGLLRAGSSPNLSLQEDERRLIAASATEQEIQRGIFNLIDEGKDCLDHVFVWRRKITTFPKSDQLRGDYQDDYGSENSPVNRLAYQLKDKLGIRYIERETKFDALMLTQTDHGSSSGPEISEYLQEFAKEMYDQLWSKINEQINASENQDDECINRQFASERSYGFVGRQRELEDIRTFLTGNQIAPYVIKAPGGMGKTSLLAKVVTDISNEFSDRSWVVRFAGASSKIGSPATLLLSLWPDGLVENAARKASLDSVSSREFLEETLLYPEIGKTRSASWPESLKDAVRSKEWDACEIRYQALKESARLHRDRLITEMIAGYEEPREKYFETFLRVIQNVMGGSIVLVIDALDQMVGYPDLQYLFARLSNRDHKRPLENFWIILSVRDKLGSNLFGLKEDDWQKVIEQRLTAAKRQLTQDQKRWVNQSQLSHGNPLVLKIASEFAVRLHSWDEPQGTLDLSSCIKSIFDQIGASSEHGVLGEHVLQYIALTRQGVPEDILLEALSRDLRVRKWFDKAYHRVKWELDRGLPPILWSRIQLDLKPYLVRKDRFGSQAINFFHREFKDEIRRHIDLDSECDVREKFKVLANAAWHHVTGSAYDPDNMDLPADIYQKHCDGWSIGELPWLMEQAGDFAGSKNLLSQPAYIMTKLGLSGGVESLLEDYRRIGNIEWGELIELHYQALLLSSTPRQVLIQAAIELPEGSSVKKNVEQWIISSGSGEILLKDIILQAKPKAEVVVGDQSSGLVELDDHRLVVWPGEDHLKIIDPDNPLVPYLFLEHWSGSQSGPAQPRNLVQLDASSLLVVLYEEIGAYANAKIVVWDGNQKVAELCTLNPIVHILKDTTTSILVVYANGRIVRWDLSKLFVYDNSAISPLQSFDEDSDCFMTLAEADDEDDRELVCAGPNGSFLFMGGHIEEYRLREDDRLLAFKGSDGSFHFRGMNTTARLVEVKGEVVREYYTQTTFVGSFCVCPVFDPSGDSFVIGQIDGSSIVNLNPAGESEMDLRLAEDQFIENIWSDSHGGLTLLLSKDIPNAETPWTLVRYTKDLSKTWTREDIPHQVPLFLRELDLIVYRTDESVHLCNLVTSSEKTYRIHEFPKKIQRIDEDNVLLSCDNEFYRLNLTTGDLARYITGSKIRGVIARRSDFLVLQPEGILQKWDAISDIPSFKCDLVAELLNGDVLACSSERFVVFPKMEGMSYHEVWKACSEELADEIRAVCRTDNGGVLTFGKQFIRLWDTSKGSWQIRDCFESQNLKFIDSKRALDIGQGRYLLEYGDGVCFGEGGNILLVSLNEDRITTLPIVLSGAWCDKHYYSLLTPEMADGDVLFRATPEYPSMVRAINLYNIRTGNLRALKMNDPELDKWILEHEKELKSFMQDADNSLKDWAESVISCGQPISRNLSVYSADTIKKTFIHAFPNTLSREVMLATNRYLGGCAIERLGIARSGGSLMASYFSPNRFRLWLNELTSNGKLYLTDSSHNLKVLQLMQGIEPTKLN